MKIVYLVLCVLGTVLPYAYFVPWLMENGFDFGRFLQECFADDISGFFTMDFLVTTLALFIFAWFEALRLKINSANRIIGIVVLTTLTVGISLGFPLFLYLRQSYLEND